MRTDPEFGSRTTSVGKDLQNARQKGEIVKCLTQESCQTQVVYNN